MSWVCSSMQVLFNRVIELPMIEEIRPHLYCLRVPLPRSPLQYTNCYVIKGDKRVLIIDTGMNLKECLTALESGLRELEIDLSKTDFFVTHLHHDHLGLVSTLATRSSKVYLSRTEVAILTGIPDDKRWSMLMDFCLANGFPEIICRAWRVSRSAAIFGPDLPVPFTSVSDGDSLQIGDYSFICVQTPGHSPGHSCLYDKDTKILLSGDHILFDITPNITQWPGLGSSLASYLQSLDRVKDLDVSLVLPGHRNRSSNLLGRIQELKRHHESRLKEAANAVSGGAKSAYEVAPYIKWDLSYKGWDEFPVDQKYFALGETIAHLEFLVVQNELRKEEIDGKIKYSPV